MIKIGLSIIFVIINGYFSLKILDGDNIWANFSGLATVDIAILTALIVAFGSSQLNETKKNNVRSFSHNAYSKYLKLTLEYPHFANPEPELIKSDMAMHSHYRWFISNMLFYFEEVLMINDKDKDWDKAIRRQVKIHMWQIGFSNYKEQGWSSDLLKIIDSLPRSRYQRANGIKVGSKELGEIENLYLQYLTLLLKYPTYYKQDESTEEIVSSNSEYFVFLRNAFCLLGYMMELSAGDSEWTALIKAEKQKLEATYKFLSKNKFINNEFILKKHTKLLIM